mmetsp:Transcript_81217/g.226093  ORF Transcript_81217/g.226093 Transcript_81217/m.226093 type:complete len:238 (-) Transcript_81217:117-830(-)
MTGSTTGRTARERGASDRASLLRGWRMPRQKVWKTTCSGCIGTRPRQSASSLLPQQSSSAGEGTCLSTEPPCCSCLALDRSWRVFSSLFSRGPVLLPVRACGQTRMGRRMNTTRRQRRRTKRRLRPARTYWAPQIRPSMPIYRIERHAEKVTRLERRPMVAQEYRIGIAGRKGGTVGPERRQTILEIRGRMPFQLPQNATICQPARVVWTATMGLRRNRLGRTLTSAGPWARRSWQR